VSSAITRFKMTMERPLNSIEGCPQSEGRLEKRVSRVRWKLLQVFGIHTAAAAGAASPGTGPVAGHSRRNSPVIETDFLEGFDNRATENTGINIENLYKNYIIIFNLIQNHIYHTKNIDLLSKICATAFNRGC
jgi:hypothetical protein